MGFMFKRLEKYAASGAAQTPPMIKPKIGCHETIPRTEKNAKELAKETKNSAKFTDPTTMRGCFPLAIKVEDTTGPHPPPPIESRNPPKKANHPAFFTFLRRGFFLITLTIIKTPRKRVYELTIGRM